MLLSKSLTIHAPAQRVFDYWADFSNFQHFIPIIDNIDVIDDRQSRWTIKGPLGYTITFDSFIITYEPDSNLVWESRHDGGKARGDIRLTGLGESTRVELDFEYEIHHHRMRTIALTANRLGFPSLAFDLGLAHIKDRIEKESR